MESDGSCINRDGSNLSFILNPRSRCYFPEITHIAASRWPGSRFFASSDEKELYEFGKKAAGDRGKHTPVVVACGGDGTFRTVASAVADRAILGIVPMGTVNLVAYQLGIPRDIHSAIQLLEEGHPAYIYPGCCSWGENDMCRLFFVSVSMGTDADAVHHVSEKLKALFGGVAYAVSFLARLLFHPLPKVEVNLDDKTSFENGIIVAPSGYYGGQNIISARQSLYKPGVEIICIHSGRNNIFRFFLALFLKIGKCTDFASYVGATQVGISCPPHGRFQIDGDKLSAQKITIRSTDIPLAVIANRH